MVEETEGTGKKEGVDMWTEILMMLGGEVEEKNGFQKGPGKI